MSAPIGRTAGGLPVRMQIIGPLFEDDTAIAFAELLLADVTWRVPVAATDPDWH